MRRPTTENAIENGDGNTQIGHNSGTITVGYTVQEHEAALEKPLPTRRQTSNARMGRNARCCKTNWIRSKPNWRMWKKTTKSALTNWKTPNGF